MNRTALLASWQRLCKPPPAALRKSTRRTKLLCCPESNATEASSWGCAYGRTKKGQVQLRESNQTHALTAAGTRSDDIRDAPIVGLGERAYESTKLAALFDVLVSRGHRPDEILKGVNLPVNEVHSPKARISLKQLMIACKNAIGLLSDRHLPFRVGTSIHISTYGMYGFAILCCPEFRSAMAFAARYHSLAAPLATI